VTPIAQRGAAVRLRQSMDTVGAFVGPHACDAADGGKQRRFRLVFWVAVIPAPAAVLVIIFGVRERAASRADERREFPIRRAELVRLNAGFWWLVGASTR
jgi:hypothetical protein